MDELRLDLEALEVERVDVGAIGLSNGLASLGMAHGATEFGHSCTCDDCDDGGMCFSCAAWEAEDAGIFQTRDGEDTATTGP